MLKDLIDTKLGLTPKLINDWNSVYSILKNDYIESTIKIDNNVAYAYTGDFFSVLRHFNVPEEFFYPHLIVNGFTDPSAYRHTDTTLLLIDSRQLKTYYDIFTRK